VGHVARMVYDKCLHSFVLEVLRDQSDDFSIDGRIILIEIIGNRFCGYDWIYLA
jgi:hypothetical protein